MSSDQTSRSLASDARRLDRLGAIVSAAFASQTLLTPASGEEFYPKLRADLAEAGATEEDFDGLTTLLIRLVLEADKGLNEKAKKAQLRLIATHFAFRDFTIKVENGVLSVDFLPPPIRH